MNIKYGFHTFDCKHIISYKEALLIKQQLNYGIHDLVKNETKYSFLGVSSIAVIETKRRYTKNGEEDTYNEKTIYELSVRINCCQMLSENRNAIMEYSVPNIKRLIKKVNRFLRLVLNLDVPNANFENWSIERLDDAFDIELDYDPRDMIYILNSSLRMPPSRRLQRYKESEVTQDSILAYESVYFGNNSYTMNVYAKWYEMKKRNPELSENDPMFRVLRVERQGNQQYVKNYLPDRKVKDLFEKENILKMLFSLKNLVKTFWRTENYPGGLYNLIDSVYPDKPKSKKYSQFAVPKYDKANKRYKVSMTVHSGLIKRGKPMYASGKTFDDCQRSMFMKLKECNVWNSLFKISNDGIIKDLLNFRHTIKSEQLLADVDAFLKENTKEDNAYAEDERAKHT